MISKDKIIELLGDHLPKYIYNAKEFDPGVTPVYYSGPYWDQKEIVAGMNSFLNGKWVSAGENVNKFEYQFSKQFNVNFSQMVNSGSSANLVLISALKKHFNWEDGDEIIVSPVGFPTTISVIVQNNLKPVFIDIEWNTLNFNLDLIEEKITPKTKAIFVSPVLGNPPDMDRLMQICEKYNLQLVGDNCDSLGSRWKGKYLNEYYVAFSNSFYPAHHISTAEGGMVCSDHEELKKLFMSFTLWGRSCHPSGTKIYTSLGVKNIEDVIVGDKVYTHGGKFENVYELIQNQYSGKLLTFKSKRNYDVISTIEHPFLIKRGSDISWIRANDIQKGDYLLRKSPITLDTPKTIKIEYTIKTTQREDKIKSFELGLGPDLFRLLGYWLAEGSCTKSFKDAKHIHYCYRIEFSFHEKETEYHEDVSNLMFKYFGIKTHIRTFPNKGIKLCAKSRKAYAFFSLFGNRSYNKQLPYNFINYDEQLLKEMLKGFWRGDGTNNWQSFSISSTSENLVNQIRFILSKFGISPGVAIRTPDKFYPAKNMPTVAKHNLYTLTCFGDNMRKMGELLNEKYEPKLKHVTTEYECGCGNYVLHEVTDIITEEVDNYPVFNFDVENDHSYHANGLVSHNCHCVGSANLLACGTCGNRFDRWLDNYDGIVDHKYVFSNMGYNLKPMDLQGAIGCVQLEKLDEIEHNRKRSKSTIEDIFVKNLPQVRGVNTYQQADVSWFGTPLICETKELKDKLVAYLEANKIQTRNYFAGNILLHPGYSHLDDYNLYPESNKVLDKVFFVGAAPHYGEEVFQYIETIVKNFKKTL